MVWIQLALTSLTVNLQQFEQLSAALVDSVSPAPPQVHKKVCKKSITSWCGQKSIVSVVLCRFPSP